MQFEQDNYNVTEGDSVSMTLLLDSVTSNNITITLQPMNGTAVGESLSTAVTNKSAPEIAHGDVHTDDWYLVSLSMSSFDSW